jgi:hypothetical protein
MPLGWMKRHLVFLQIQGIFRSGKFEKCSFSNINFVLSISPNSKNSAQKYFFQAAFEIAGK